MSRTGSLDLEDIEERPLLLESGSDTPPSARIDHASRSRTVAPLTSLLGRLHFGTNEGSSQAEGSARQRQHADDAPGRDDNASTVRFEHVNPDDDTASLSTSFFAGALVDTPPGTSKKGKATKPSTLGMLLAKATNRYERLDAKLTEATRANDFERAATLADKMKVLKPEKDYLARIGIFRRATLSRRFDLVLPWMRDIDQAITHHTFLTDVRNALETLPNDPPVRDFIDQVTRFYLEELPDAGELSMDERFEILARFAEMANGSGPAHAQQFFDKLPLNLYEAMDAMPRETARRLFYSLETIRTQHLHMNTGSELTSGGIQRPEPLTPLEYRRASMIKAGRQLMGRLSDTDHPVRMGAQLGVWALRGRNYEEAVSRLAEETPLNADVRRSIENRSMRPRPVDWSGLDIDCLPPGLETLTYITQLDVSNNRLQSVPMALRGMRYFSPYPHKIEIDLRGNPLSEMTLEDLRMLDGSHEGRGPWFRLPEAIELKGGGEFRTLALVPARRREK